MLVSISEMSKPVEACNVILIRKVTYWTFIVKGLFSSLTGREVVTRGRDVWPLHFDSGLLANKKVMQDWITKD